MANGTHCSTTHRWHGGYYNLSFANPKQSHEHSLQVLNQLYEYDDFMLSIKSMVDLGCGSEGLDLEWWATRTTRDDIPEPLDIDCTGVDIFSYLPMARKHKNIKYQLCDFEKVPTDKKYDVLWSHDTFQYCLDPLSTLARWWHLANPGGMLAITVPHTIELHRNQTAIDLPEGYYHHTMVSLMHMLAVTGWDCANGYFLKRVDDPWLHAIVYRSDIEPMNPKETSWYKLLETKLLPESAEKSIEAHGYLRQQDLVVPWIDKNHMWLGQF